MEISHRLLLVVGLLAVLIPAAAATLGPQPEAEATCEPTRLATRIALFCAPKKLTAQCCEPVLAAVDLGGGVPCLRRVAAEPQLAVAGLNATHLLTLYDSCAADGAHVASAGPQHVRAGLNATHLLPLYDSCDALRPDGSNVAAACQGPACPAAVVISPPTPPPSPAPGPNQQPAVAGPTSLGLGAGVCSLPTASPVPRRKLTEVKCDPFPLGSSLVSACGDDNHPSLPCCEYIILTVDQDCVCDVIEVPEVTGAAILASTIWTFYRTCGGTGPVPADITECLEQSPPPPPPVSPSPPPPPPSEGPPASTDESAFKKYVDNISHALTESLVGSYTMGGLMLLSVVTGIAVWAWKQYSDKHREPGLGHPHAEAEAPGQQVGGEVAMGEVQHREQESSGIGIGIGIGAPRLRRPVTSAATTASSVVPAASAPASAPPVSVPRLTRVPPVPAASTTPVSVPGLARVSPSPVAMLE